MYVGLGAAADRLGRGWLSRPLYRGAALLLMVLLELLALNGRMFHYLGVSLQAWQPAKVSDPLLLDTVAAMTLNALVFYAHRGGRRERRGTELMAGAAGILFAVSPFAVLQPLAYLVRTGEYSLRYDWIYLGLALAVTLLSERRQRKSFYYAGLLNTGARALPHRGAPALVRPAVLGRDAHPRRPARARRRIRARSQVTDNKELRP